MPHVTRPLVAVVLGAAVGALIGAVHGGFTDLVVYQFGGQSVLDGSPLYGVRDPIEGLPFTYPPVAALLFGPLALLSATAAAVVWTGLSAAALAATIVVALRSVGRTAAAWLVVALSAGAVALEPVWQNFAFGQINLIVMLLVLVDVLWPERRLAGVLLGIAAAVKLAPLVFVVFLVLVGYRAAATRAVAVFAASVAVGFIVLPDDSQTYWGGDRLIDASRVGPPALAHNQSVYGTLTRLLDHEPSTMPWMAIAAPIAAALLVVGALRWRRGDRLLGCCLAAVAMLLASPVSWSHHWVWTVPAAVALWQHTRWGAALWAAVFVARPFTWPPWGDGHEYTWTAAQQVVGNAYVLAGVVLGVWAAARVRTFTGAQRLDRASAT